ncbi:hypothetical protein F5880DRAFT_1638179, partial [Lentinula raphanica]
AVFSTRPTSLPVILCHSISCRTIFAYSIVSSEVAPNIDRTSEKNDILVRFGRSAMWDLVRLSAHHQYQSSSTEFHPVVVSTDCIPQGFKRDDPETMHVFMNVAHAVEFSTLTSIICYIHRERSLAAAGAKAHTANGGFGSVQVCIQYFGVFSRLSTGRTGFNEFGR